jgi:HEPN domain-containing protein
MQNDVEIWLLRAKSNFEHALKVNKEDLAINGGHIFYEELCFNLQQSVEKAYKALLIAKNIDFPRTHSISKLVELLQLNNIILPDYLLPSLDLTIYAVETRYPGYQDTITTQEYLESAKIAQKALEWVNQQVLTN